MGRDGQRGPIHSASCGDRLDVPIYPFNLAFYLVTDMVSETKTSRIDGWENTGWGVGGCQGGTGIEEDRIYEVEERDCRPCSNSVTNRGRKCQVVSGTVCVS